MRSFYSSVGDAAALVAVSEAQRATAPELNWTATVYNAVDVDALEIGDRADREDYLLCLARICADKGQDVAIEVARRTGRRLVLAGKVEETPEGRAFHEQRVLPFVDGEQVVHLGNVAGAEKARLLARATALLSPVRWPEPFGLALAEATCSGTPAIAFPNGAVPEVIDDGCTGFLVEDVDAMCEAVERAHDIDARAAAAHARRRFAPAAMVDGYLAVYDRVAASSRSHPG
jgi:glycosyltransferase involved in cell wall biosynthesis